MSVHASAKRITTQVLQEMKHNGEKIAMLTAYDYSMARIVDGAGVDVILVGDSASNVMAGHETTLPITLDQMIYHAAGVVRAAKKALVVVDLPFGTYQGNSKEALNSAIRIMKESGAHAVKLEGGAEDVVAGARAFRGIGDQRHDAPEPHADPVASCGKARADDRALTGLTAHDERQQDRAVQQKQCAAIAGAKLRPSAGPFGFRGQPHDARAPARPDQAEQAHRCAK